MVFTLSNLGIAMKHSKQNNARGLLGEQEMEAARLNATFVEIVGEMRPRPEPRHVWDNVASPGRTNHPAHGAVAAGQAAIDAAMATGDMALVEETTRRWDVYMDACKTAGKKRYLELVGGSLSLNAAIERASKEVAEANHAILLSVMNPACEQLAAYTDAEIIEGIEAMRDVLAARLALRGGPINRRAALSVS